MEFEPKTIRLKDGREALLRSPRAGDAQAMLDCLLTCAMETDFSLRTPEECVETEEEEARFLEGILASPDSLMIVCLVEGRIAGNCHLMRQKRVKTRHRASLAIALIREFWGLGIGRAMLEELIQAAREIGVSQLELQYLEGNERGFRLYEKLGFIEVGRHPKAVRLKDGRHLMEINMVKAL